MFVVSGYFKHRLILFSPGPNLVLLGEEWGTYPAFPFFPVVVDASVQVSFRVGNAYRFSFSFLFFFAGGLVVFIGIVEGKWETTPGSQTTNPSQRFEGS